MNYKFLIAAPLIALALFLQILLGDTSGIWINFVLAALIAAAFFVNLIELFALILFSVLVLNWQPAFSFELALLSLLPITTLLLRRRIPFSPRLANILAVFTGLLVLYLSFGAEIFIRNPEIFLRDAAISIMVASMAFQVMRGSLSRRF